MFIPAQSCLPMFTPVHSCLLVFTHILSCFPVYHCFLIFKHLSLPQFTRARSSMFNNVYHIYICLPIFSPCLLVFTFLLVFTYVYTCLPLFTTDFSSLATFSTLYSCLFDYVYLCLLVFTTD